jgi:hypothetical protein
MFWPKEMQLAEEGCESRARQVHASVDFLRGRELAVRVDVAAGVEIDHGIDHDLRDLAAAGAVEKGEIRALTIAHQGGEILATARRVFGGECHTPV